MRARKPFPQGHARAAFPHFYAYAGFCFSLTAGVLSDFTIPWDETEVIYELVTIVSLLFFALLMQRSQRLINYLVVGGAVLAFLASLVMEVKGISFLPFLCLRLGLSPMISYAFGVGSAVIGTHRRLIPFSFCALISYAAASVLLYTQIIPHHFGAVCAVFIPLGAIFLLCSNAWMAGEAFHTSTSAERKAGSSSENMPKTIVLLIALFLIIGQLVNGLDAILFSLIAQNREAGSINASLPILLLLIGFGYLLGGLVAYKLGLSVLFIASCVVMQFFLLIALIPDQILLRRSVLPLYVIGSAGIDLSMILSSRTLWKRNRSPTQAIAGYVLFRISKLTLLPLLFPVRWKTMTLGRLVVVLTILFTMGQMLMAFHLLFRRKAEPQQHIAGTAAERPLLPPLPETMTPREKEVARLLLEGKDRNTIAAHMGISFSTVNKHCVAIYRKTGCTSHVELMVKYGHAGEHNTDA